MKYILITFLCSITLNAQHTIKTEIIGNIDFKSVQLKKFKNNEWIVLDSATVHKNKFQFKTEHDDEMIYIDTSTNTRFYIKLYNVKGSTKVTYNLVDYTYIAKGTKLNEGFTKFQAYIKPYNDTFNNLTLQKPVLSNPNNFTKEDFIVYNDYLNSIKKIKEDIDDATLNYIISNKNDEYIKILIIEKLKNNFNENQYNKLKALYNNLDDITKKTENALRLKTFLDEFKNVIIGAKVSDFKIPDVNNNQQSLYENLGKYTLIDFWASWCGPCRKENPHVVKMYERYKDKGLKIIGVSLDDNKDRWVNAIEKDKLHWLQLSNLMGWNEPILSDFKVTSIPQTYLIDKNGVIVAKNLRGKELEDKLAQLFN